MPSKRPRAIADAGAPTARGSVYHILYTLVVCGAGISLLWLFAQDLATTDLLVIVPTFFIANLVEYAVHRWLMHRHVRVLVAMLKLHMVHHNYFAENDYYLRQFID